MGTLQHLLGDYAVTIKFETLLHQHGGGTSEADRDLARLYRARAAFASEVAEGQHWNLGVVKQLTGGDKQRARWLYGEAFDFAPTAKLWCRANEKPAAYDPSNGFWRRVRLLPFEHSIPDRHQDKQLRHKLLSQDELPGILNWALEGLAQWHRRGRLPKEEELPARVRAATDAYRAE
jgi:putative DNA primase/helicase